jgi:integrase
MKIDPYNHREKYIKWKKSSEKGISGLNKANSDIILKYLNDMEKGINIASGSVKGPRGYARLNTLRGRLLFFAKRFYELCGLENISNVTEEQLISFFSDMKSGAIKKPNGKNYLSVDTYTTIFKAFWHWYMKVNRKNGNEIPDITVDLDTKQEKPRWVYLNEQQVKRLSENVKYNYRVLIMFLFDTGIRSPTELINIKVSDLYNDYRELHIREEISKTFGRKIKLMLCSSILKEYIKNRGLNENDYLFKISPPVTNKYLQRVAKRILGDGESLAGEKYCKLTMYDFRHISCCYWLPRYKSESALKYRFGWKKSDKIHYYSELLGMKDTISDDDLLIDVTKTEIEKRLEKSEKEKELIQEKMFHMETQMKEILEMVNKFQFLKENPN